MSYYHDDDEEIDVRVRRHRDASPSPVHYVEARARPRSYYATGPSYLQPERTVVTTRTRSRSRERRSSPPSQAPAPAPIIINNYQGHSSDDDSVSIEDRTVALTRHTSHHSSHSRPRAPSSAYMTREEYEIEETRRELEEMKLQQLRKRDDYELSRTRRELEDVKTAAQRDDFELSRTRRELQDVKTAAQRDDYELSRTRRELQEIKGAAQRERDDRHREKEYRDQAELERAKRELDEIKRREEREIEEKRIKKELELKQLEADRRAKEEKDRLDKAEKEAIERYKAKEAERMLKEKREKEQAEKEYQRRLQEDLLNAGVDEKDIQAIVKREKIKREEKKDRPTYTRMARRHLSIETLRVYGIDFDYDQDPSYVIIKRWVPEDEQDILWRHTKIIREKRSKVVVKIEDKEHHHHHHKSGNLEPEFEWVRKKERRRSKSPGLLMYLAGAK